MFTGSELEVRSARSFYLPTALSAVYALLVAFVVFLLPVYLKERLGFSGAQIGALFAAYGVTAVIAVFPSGLSTDAVTPRRVLFVASLVTAAAAVGMARARSFAPVVACFLSFGLAGHCVKVAVESFLFKTHDAARTGETFGLYQVFRMGGYGLALLASGVLLTRIDFPATLLLLAAATAAVALGTLALPEIPAAWSGLALYAKDIRRRDVVVFSAWLFLYTSHWGAETTSYGLFVREVLGLSFSQMGLFMSGEFATFCAAAYLFGRRYDRGADLGRILFFGVLLSGIGHVAMVYPFVPTSLLARLVHGLGDGMVSVVMYVGVARLFLRERVGGNSGLVNLVAMAGVLVAALTYGPLGERLGYGAPLFTSGLIMLGLTLFPQLRHGASGVGRSR